MKIRYTSKIDLSFLLLKLMIIIQYFNLIADLFPSYFQIIIFFMWFLTKINNKIMIGKMIKLNYISIIILIITFFRCIIADQLNMSYYSSLQVVIQRYQFLIYPMIYLYINDLHKRKKEKLLKLSLICISLTILISLYYCIFVDPQAIRNTIRDHQLLGVGDFQLMYALAIFVGPLLFFIKDKLKKNKKLFFNFVFGLIISCLLLCNLVTSIVVACLSIVVTYLVKTRNKYMIISIVFFSSTMYALKNYFAEVLYSIAAKEIFYWSTNNKIIAIANVLTGNMSNIDTLSRRMMLATQSLNSFFKYPIFGISFRSHIEGNVGCHCQWVDDLARFGIIGNLVIVYNYLKIAKYSIRNVFDKNIKDYMISSWIVFFILGFLNPCLSGTILMMIFIVIPCMEF